MATDPFKLKFFAQYIEAQIGIIYSETNYFQLEHRLNDIVKLLGYNDVDALWLRAQNGIDGQLRDLLLDLATNNETSFFRDPAIFAALTQHLVAELKGVNPSLSSLNIWSAAGSTGQEAYSVAMAMDQASRATGGLQNYDILVSDVSDRVLSRAKEGLYSQLEIQRGLPTQLLIEYFEKEGESSWRVKSHLRDRLRFKQINLLEPLSPSLGMFDVIFCRNVLIYQSVENKIAVVGRLLNVIAPHGYLVLGAAESMLGISNAFKQVQFGAAVAYRKI